VVRIKLFEMYAADVLASYRAVRQRIGKHPLYVVWFIFLDLAVFGGVVWFVALVINSGEAVQYPLEVADLLFLMFMAFLGKSLLDYYHLLIERPASVFLFSQPLSRHTIVASKLLTVSVYNLALLALGLGIITGFTFLHPGLYFVIPPYLVADAIILMLLASSIGLMYSVVSSLGSWPRKIAATIMYSPMVSLVWLFTLQLRWEGWQLTQALFIVWVLSLIAVPLSSHLILEAWNTMTSSRSKLHRRLSRERRPSWLRRLVSKEAYPVYEKELKTLLRKREGVGNAITLAGFVIFAFYFYSEVDQYLELPAFAIAALPILVVGLSLFLAVVLLALIPALGAISKDGRSTWVLKSMPVRTKHIIEGKLASISVMLPFIIVFVALPVPMLAGLPPISYLFSAMGAAVMFLLAAGIGIWLGAKYPNFTESISYSPDVMTMYIVMMLALFVSAFLLLPPLAIAFADKFLGFLILILALDVACVIFILGKREAEKLLGDLEVTF